MVHLPNRFDRKSAKVMAMNVTEGSLSPRRFSEKIPGSLVRTQVLAEAEVRL